jgi:hypothetical protein
MKKIFLSLLSFTIIFSACKKGDTGPQGPAGPAGSNNPAPLPIACFTVDDSLTVDSTQVFSFTNCSQNAVRYEWDFDDATYAPVANPNHLFNKHGSFTVRMTAYNADNVSSQVSHVITIGYHSLNRIEYHQLYSILTMPATVSLYNLFFNVTDIINQGQLPFTSLLADSSIYHFNPAVSYNLRTQDGSGHNYNRVFPVAESSIINNRFDTLFTLSSDTTRFTLYYNIYY